MEPKRVLNADKVYRSVRAEKTEAQKKRRQERDRLRYLAKRGLEREEMLARQREAKRRRKAAMSAEEHAEHLAKQRDAWQRRRAAKHAAKKALQSPSTSAAGSSDGSETQGSAKNVRTVVETQGYEVLSIRHLGSSSALAITFKGKQADMNKKLRIRNCMVVGCTKTTKPLHQVPQNYELRRAWLERIGIPPSDTRTYIYVCGRHFAISAHMLNPDLVDKSDFACRWRLRPDAVPTLFLPTDSAPLQQYSCHCARGTVFTQTTPSQRTVGEQTSTMAMHRDAGTQMGRHVTTATQTAASFSQP